MTNLYLEESTLRGSLIQKKQPPLVTSLYECVHYYVLLNLLTQHQIRYKYYSLHVRKLMQTTNLTILIIYWKMFNFNMMKKIYNNIFILQRDLKPKIAFYVMKLVAKTQTLFVFVSTSGILIQNAKSIRIKCQFEQDPIKSTRLNLKYVHLSYPFDSLILAWSEYLFRLGAKVPVPDRQISQVKHQGVAGSLMPCHGRMQFIWGRKRVAEQDQLCSTTLNKWVNHLLAPFTFSPFKFPINSSYYIILYHYHSSQQQ
jgi:hypothetical protein